MTSFTIRALRRLLVAGLVALPLGLAAQAPAEAAGANFSFQVSGPNGSFSVGNHGIRSDRYGYGRRAVLPPHRIVRRLRRQGFHDPRGLSYVPARQIYRVDARSYDGRPVRLRVDARTGQALRVTYLSDDRRGRGEGRRDRNRGGGRNR